MWPLLEVHLGGNHPDADGGSLPDDLEAGSARWTAELSLLLFVGFLLFAPVYDLRFMIRVKLHRYDVMT